MSPMLAALTPALGSILVVITGVAALPVLLAGSPEPLPRRAVAAPAAMALVLARTASGTWYANGLPMRQELLARQLRARGASLRIRFLPSPGLSAAEVSQQLEWLRRQSRGAVQLELASQG
ncbi:MAG: hypothetical protein EBX49_01865 [Synechococcaceae bacterium WB8_1B_136]|nr:hypothetical protein [Synechococcaceae bacterium WB8_1B_136]